MFNNTANSPARSFKYPNSNCIKYLLLSYSCKVSIKSFELNTIYALLLNFGYSPSIFVTNLTTKVSINLKPLVSSSKVLNNQLIAYLVFCSCTYGYNFFLRIIFIHSRVVTRYVWLYIHDNASYLRSSTIK